MPRGNSRSENELRDRVSIAVRPGEDMDVEELVNVLRDVYPEYRRQKLNPFTRCVEEIMNNMAPEGPAEANNPSYGPQACITAPYFVPSSQRGCEQSQLRGRPQ